MTAAAGAESNSLFNKVPEVTLAFWTIKVMVTTVGETGPNGRGRQPKAPGQA